jgi:hypothetical protein
MSEDQSLNINNHKSTSIYRHQRMKEVKEKDGQFLSSVLFSSLPQCDYNHNKEKEIDMISIILLCSSICLFPTSSELTFITQPDGESQWKSRG